MGKNGFCNPVSSNVANWSYLILQNVHHALYLKKKNHNPKNSPLLGMVCFCCSLFSFSSYTTGLLCALMSWRDLGFQGPMSASGSWAFIFNEKGAFSLFLWKKGSCSIKLRVSLCSSIIFPLTLAQNRGREHILKGASVRKPRALLFLGNMNKRTLLTIRNLGRK